jgi:uncharacterized protein
MDRIAPTRRPAGPNAGRQRWRDLLFVHCEVPAALVRPLVPSALELDLWEGRCLVGIVPFAMFGVQPSWAPFGFDFLELNVRLYVHHGGRPGVWFLSLDAANLLAVWAARLGWSLPYHHAAMRLEKRGEAFDYVSRRRGGQAAGLQASYTVGADLGTAQPGTLEHFLVERYLLFSKHRGALLVGQVHHEPYPVRQAELGAFEQTMLAANGIAGEHPIVSTLYSPGVDVEVFALRPLLRASGRARRETRGPRRPPPLGRRSQAALTEKGAAPARSFGGLARKEPTLRAARGDAAVDRGRWRRGHLTP